MKNMRIWLILISICALFFVACFMLLTSIQAPAPPAPGKQFIERLTQSPIWLPPSPQPSLPAPGRQEIVKLNKDNSCVSDVEDRTKAWAVVNHHSHRVLFASPVSIDVEMIPASYLAKLDKGSVITIQQFENACMLFYDRYSGKPNMQDKLKQYLNHIQLMPERIIDKDLLTQGFTRGDAKHLREHLTTIRSEADRRNAVGIYQGIRYFRVTYSVTPNSEFTINTGTVEGYELTAHQNDLIGSLRTVISEAVKCNSETR
jgi:hypothetical protein